MWEIWEATQFSTDLNPAKSKSKCIFFRGKLRNVVLPDQLSLFGEPLLWVSHAEHLRHTIHDYLTMDLDDRRKRAIYIGKTSKLTETVNCAHPSGYI